MKQRNRLPLSEYKSLASYEVKSENNPHFETQYIDEELLSLAIQFYNQYFGYFIHPIDREEALMYADLGVRINADLWKSMMPMSHDKIEFFYKTTPLYFFHDILRFMDGIHRANFDKWTSERDSIKHIDNVLDFAGGTGGYSIMFAKRGTKVTFVDSNKLQSEWVKFVAFALKLPITVKASLDEVEGTFDGIIAQDVIEHVFDPVALINRLRSFSHKDGSSFMSASEMPCCGPEEFAPMHFKVVKDDKDIISFKYLDNYRLMDMTLAEHRWLMKENYNSIVSRNSVQG